MVVARISLCERGHSSARFDMQIFNWDLLSNFAAKPPPTAKFTTAVDAEVL